MRGFYQVGPGFLPAPRGRGRDMSERWSETSSTSTAGESSDGPSRSAEEARISRGRCVTAGHKRRRLSEAPRQATSGSFGGGRSFVPEP